METLHEWSEACVASCRSIVNTLIVLESDGNVVGGPGKRRLLKVIENNMPNVGDVIDLGAMSITAECIDAWQNRVTTLFHFLVEVEGNSWAGVLAGFIALLCACRPVMCRVVGRVVAYYARQVVADQRRDEWSGIDTDGSINFLSWRILCFFAAVVSLHGEGALSGQCLASSAVFCAWKCCWYRPLPQYWRGVERV